MRTVHRIVSDDHDISKVSCRWFSPEQFTE